MVSDVAIEERVKMADMMTKCTSEEERSEGRTLLTYHFKQSSSQCGGGGG